MYDELLLFYRATHIPVSLFRGGNLVHNVHGNKQDYNIPMFLFEGLPADLPPFWQSRLTEHAIFGGMEPDAGELILLGPVPLHELTAHHVIAIMREAGRKAEDVSEVFQYFSNQTICDESMLPSALRLLARLLGRELAGEPAVVTYRRTTGVPPIIVDPEEDQSDPVMEAALLGAIRNGDVDGLRRMFNLYQLGAGGSSRAELPPIMRSYIIGAITMMSREAVRGGVDYAYAMKLCSFFMDRMLSARDSRRQSDVFRDAMLRFAGEVHRVKTSLPESAGPLARKVSSYVLGNVYIPLSPTIVAEALGYTTSYLCNAFRKQTGMTIAEFVNRQKVEEAKKLLDARPGSVGRVGAELGYTSQSYFSTIFHRYAGMTPGEWAASNSL